MPLPPKLKAGCGALTLFLAGVFSGIVAMILLLVFIIPRSDGWKKDDSKNFLANHLSKQLDLTDEQRKDLRPGFNQYLNQRWELRSEYLKEDRDVLERYLETVKPSLTPEQLKQLHQIQERWWKGKERMIKE